MTRSMSCSTIKMAVPSPAGCAQQVRRTASRPRPRPDRTTARRGGAASARSRARAPSPPTGPHRWAPSRHAASAYRDMIPDALEQVRRHRPRLACGRTRPRTPPLISRATWTFSRTVSEPNASSRWKVRPMPRVWRPRVRPGRSRLRVMSWPRKRTRPRVGGCRPVMTLNSVVLPAPFGPIRPVTVPPSTDMLTRRRPRSRHQKRTVTPCRPQAAPWLGHLLLGCPRSGSSVATRPRANAGSSNRLLWRDQVSAPRRGTSDRPAHRP